MRLLEVLKQFKPAQAEVEDSVAQASSSVEKSCSVKAVEGKTTEEEISSKNQDLQAGTPPEERALVPVENKTSGGC